MAVGIDAIDAARQLDAARIDARDLEVLADDGHDLFRQNAAITRRDSPVEAALGEAIDALAGNAILLGEVFRRIAHIDATCRVVERFPEEILELDLAHGEAVAVRIGGNRIAAHRFTASAQRQFHPTQRDRIRRLRDDFEPGAADALHQMRRSLDRRPRIKPDMAGGDIGIERGLRHRAGNGMADIGRLYAGALDRRSGGLDAQVNGRNLGQGTAIIDERRASPAQEPGVIEGEAKAFAHVRRLSGAG